MSEQPQGATMEWQKDYDANDNTIWELVSPMHDDGDPLLYRLRQELRDDAIVWVDASSDCLTAPGDTWEMLLEAVRDTEEAWRACERECEAAASPTTEKREDHE